MSDTSVWGLPLVILGFGGLFGLFLASRARSSEREAREITAEGRRDDLLGRREATVRALRDLEAEKEKLSSEEYERQRRELLARGADALRALDEGEVAPAGLSEAALGVLRAERERVGEAAWAEALALAGLAPAAAAAPAPGIAPAWRGAGWTLAAVSIIGGLLWFAQNEATDRVGDAPMTGGTTAEAPEDPEVAALREKVSSNPNDLESLNRLTVNALSTGNLNDAMQWNERALAVTPNDADARTFRAVLRAATGMGDSALTLLDEVLAEHPTNTMALVYKGLIALEAGKNESAISALERALALDPPNPSFLRAKLAEAQLGGPPAAPAETSAPTAIASGRIQLAAGVDTAAFQALFVSVRDPAGGPPLAAKKLSPGPFPMDFTITSADRLPMGGDRPMPAQVDFTVRLDVDGDAMSRSDGEPSARIPSLAVGSAGLEITVQ
jgi:cytochrome c-type biogenesis protein CcmH